MKDRKATEDIRAIFEEAVRRVDPYRMIHDRVKCEENLLVIRTDYSEYKYDLNDFSKIIVIGAGKATAKMAVAVEEILQDRISEGLISVKPGHTEQLNRIAVIEAGHPVPDDNSLRAARGISGLAEKADEKTLAVGLLSGGGSALLSFPWEITLDDKQKTTELLLACGATIHEINCVRKHLSLIKGGRLAETLYPATSVNLVLSDVVGDRLDVIASGLTAPDMTTYEDAMAVLEKYSIRDRVPKSTLAAIVRGKEGAISETPKQGNVCFEATRNVLIGTNYTALAAAREKAESLGYSTLVLSSQITGEAKEIAKFYLGIARDCFSYDVPVEKPACILGGGETTVTIKGGGKGGRNQEMALSFLAESMLQPEKLEGITFLSGGTDGNDGPTDAAGAFACAEAAETTTAHGLDPFVFLRENDSYRFFEKIGYLFKPGPTNTNVCDIQILTVTKNEGGG